MERKFFTLTRFQVLTITMLILLTPFCAYYVRYVRSQKSYFTNRNFRLLAAISDQIKSKIENLNKVLKNASNVDTDRKKSIAEAEVRNVLKLVPSLFINKLSIPAGKDRDPGILLDPKQEEGEFWLYIDYRDRPKKGPHTVGIYAKTNFNELIGPFVNRDEFDGVLESQHAFEDILVTKEDGTVILQRAPSQLSITTLATLTDKEGKKIDFNLSNQSSSALDVQIAGADYKLFLQPVQIFLSTNNLKNYPVKWVVCGLERADHFRWESLAVSYTFLITFVFLALLVALSWPFLKLWFMGPKDRLRVMDVCFLGFSALMGSAVLTFFLVDTYTYTNFEQQMDEQLEKLACKIYENFHDEVGHAVEQLHALNKKNELKRDLSAVEARSKRESSRQENGRSSKKRTNILGCPGKADCNPLIDYKRDAYPYLKDMVVWIDKDGYQRVKWTAQEHATPFIKVADRMYFRNVREGRSLKDGIRSDPFWLEPIYSWNTGENVAILAMDMCEPEGWVAAIDTQPLSVIQTVLPTGFGYCIIDDDGKVLFHSNVKKNLRENFFQECDNNGLLRAAVLGRTKEWVNAQYQGWGHRLYVRPIDHFPWSLIVYRDKNILRTANLELLTISMLLFIFYSLILFIISLIYLLSSGDRGQWVWPNKDRSSTYYQLFTLNTLSSVVFCVGIWKAQSAEHTMVFALLSPLFGILLAYLYLKKGPIFRRWKGAFGFFEGGPFFTYRLGYVLVPFSLLILVGILPSLAFFKIGRDTEMMLLVKHGQLHLAKGLKERAARVRSDYSHIELGGQGEDRAKVKQEFLDKRLNLDWDVYDFFFFNTTWKPLFSCPSGREGAPDDLQRFFMSIRYYFKEFLTKIRPLYNETCIKMRALMDNASADAAWRWELCPPALEANGEERLVLHKNGDGENDFLHISSTLPRVKPPADLLQAILWSIGPISFLIGLFLLVRFVARRVFFLNLDEPLPLFGEDLGFGTISQNLILLASPFARRSERWRREEFYIIDLRRVAKGENWAATFNYEELPKEKVIAIDHFEYRMDDPLSNREKLRLLEELLFDNRTVVVVSTVDPMDYWVRAPFENNSDEKQNPPTPPYTGRWVSVLSSFLKVYVEDQATVEAFSVQQEADQRMRSRLYNLSRRLVEDECKRRAYLRSIGKEIISLPEFTQVQLSLEQLFHQILERTYAYYHAIWATCSQDEKVTLFYLAYDRFVSSKNPEIRRLLRRGLIVRDPDLRLMNESFKRFVISAIRPEEVAACEQEEVRSDWNTLKVPFLIGLMSVALFLFMTQHKVFDLTMAFVSSMTAGIPALFKFFSLFQRDKINNIAKG